MNWLKHNLVFSIGAVVALGMLLGAISYCLNGWSNNVQQTVQLNESRAVLQRMTQSAAASVNVEKVRLQCRAFDHSQSIAGANEQMAHELAAQLKQSLLLDEVKLDEQVKSDVASPGTFTIGVTLKLREPLQVAAAQ